MHILLARVAGLLGILFCCTTVAYGGISSKEDGVAQSEQVMPGDAAPAATGDTERQSVDTLHSDSSPPGSGEMLVRRSNAHSLYFAYGATRLSDSALEVIGFHAARLKADDGLSVSLYGFTDDFSSSSYSIALGNMRAQVVKDQLLALGVAPGQVRIVSYGYVQAEQTPCRTEICRADHRRVEFHFEKSR